MTVMSTLQNNSSDEHVDVVCNPSQLMFAKKNSSNKKIPYTAQPFKIKFKNN